MGLIIQWFWYLLAFLAGSSMAWVLAVIWIPHAGKDAALADMPGSREPGQR
jgi:uncharacterized membrane protein ArfB